MTTRVSIKKTFTFEAAHLLPNVPDGHKCGRLHGHSFQFDVELYGFVNPDTGMVMDYGEIKAIVHPFVVNRLDHYYLNEITGLKNPTSENLAVWIWDRISSELPDLASITVRETCTSECVYRGPND